MSDLPPDLTFGFVRFKTVLAVADTADAGRNPDSQGATGTVTFTAKTLVVTAYESGEPVTVGKQVITCPLDASGNMLERIGGAVGVWLVTGQYVVTYAVDGVTLAQHDILVEATHTLVAPLFLSTFIPPGPSASVSEYAALSARIIVLESNPKITASPAGSPPASPVLNQIWVKY